MAMGPSSDDAPFLVVKAATEDTNDVDNLPDDESAAGQELDDTGDDLSGIDAVHTAKATEDEQRK